MKKFFLLSLLAFMSSLCGNQNDNGFFYISSDLLIWQMREQGADNWGQVMQPAGAFQEMQLLPAPFKWKPGFRIGVGYNSNHDLWDVLFSYTWYRTNAVLLTNQTSSFVFSSFLGNFFIDNTNGAKLSGPIYKDASIQWDVLFNTFDLEVGRVFYTDAFLTLRPFIGLKGGVINQKISTTWQVPFDQVSPLIPPVPVTTFSSAVENLKNNFGGIGPSGGLNASWHLYTTPDTTCNFFGNFSGALILGHWNLSDLYQNNAPQSVAIINDKITSALTMVRGNMGLEWLHDINDDVMLTLRVSYESQVWLNMLRFYSLNGGRFNNLLSLHGGVVEVGVTF